MTAMPADPDLEALIEALRPAQDADETPHGRLAGIDRDTWLTYREMYRLLTSPPGAGDHEHALHDLASTLLDLQRSAEQAFHHLFMERVL